MMENIHFNQHPIHGMRRRPVIFDAEYFYYSDSNSHQTLICE